MGSRSDLWMATAPYGLIGTVTSAGGALFHLWQLGDVGRDSPRLIKSQRLGDSSITRVGVAVHIGKSLSIGVHDLEAAV